MVNFVYTFVGTLFIQMWSIFVHLRVIYTIVVDFLYICGRFYTYVGIYIFEGPTAQSQTDNIGCFHVDIVRHLQ